MPDGDTVVAKVEFVPYADLEGVDKELAYLIGRLNLSGTFTFLPPPLSHLSLLSSFFFLFLIHVIKAASPALFSEAKPSATAPSSRELHPLG